MMQDVDCDQGPPLPNKTWQELAKELRPATPTLNEESEENSENLLAQVAEPSVVQKKSCCLDTNPYSGVTGDDGENDKNLFENGLKIVNLPQEQSPSLQNKSWQEHAKDMRSATPTLGKEGQENSEVPLVDEPPVSRKESSCLDSIPFSEVLGNNSESENEPNLLQVERVKMVKIPRDWRRDLLMILCASAVVILLVTFLILSLL